MAVLSRLTCPMSTSCKCAVTSAAWVWSSTPDWANSAQARLKVAALGTWFRASQPQRRRKAGSTCSRSSSASVVGEIPEGFGEESPQQRATVMRYSTRGAFIP